MTLACYGALEIVGVIIIIITYRAKNLAYIELWADAWRFALVLA